MMSILLDLRGHADEPGQHGRAAARSPRESNDELRRQSACSSNYFLRLFSRRIEQAGWAEPGWAGLRARAGLCRRMTRAS